jgi:hypothetical protein
MLQVFLIREFLNMTVIIFIRCSDFGTSLPNWDKKSMKLKAWMPESNKFSSPYCIKVVSLIVIGGFWRCGGGFGTRVEKIDGEIGRHGDSEMGRGED